MTEQRDKDLQRLAQGRDAQAMRDILDEELSDREQKLAYMVYDIFRSGETLDPQLAVQKWAELYAIHQLRRSLRQREKAGKAAATRLGASLT